MSKMTVTSPLWWCTPDYSVKRNDGHFFAFAMYTWLFDREDNGQSKCGCKTYPNSLLRKLTVTLLHAGPLQNKHVVLDTWLTFIEKFYDVFIACHLISRINKILW